MDSRATVALIALIGCTSPAAAPVVTSTPLPPAAAQNPSPMVETTRVHERLTQHPLPGVTRSFAGPYGKPVEMFVPSSARTLDTVDLVVHFHGAAWLPEQAVAALPHPTIAAVLNLGSGSGVYDRAFVDPVREILRDPRHFARVDAVLLLDGMHTSYVPEHTVLANGGTIDSTNLVAFEHFARAAMRGQKRFVVTHSEIFPGTFASTTETADWLLHSVGLHRTPVLRWGPRGLQQLSEVHSGNFELMGFAGNSAPDHIDQLHAMPELLALTVSGIATIHARSPKSALDRSSVAP
jgi:hypothetical protein